MQEYPEPTADDPFLPHSAWNRALVWSMLGLVAWAGFELTAQPAVVAAVVCSKVGWNDLLTAVWLRRRDPHRGRGRACSWFCLSAGVTKMVISSFAMTILLSTVLAVMEGGKPRQNANPQFPVVLTGPLILMAAGAPVLALLAFLGCLSARWNRVRVWIDDPLHHARRADAWPPDFSGARNHNMARGPWLIMLAFAIVMAMLLATMVGALTKSYTVGVLTLIAPIFWICQVSRGAFADRPAECWEEAIHSTAIRNDG
jgi:hypothetical protein